MERPWHKRALELEPTEGPHSDFVAFREWFTKKETRQDSDILGSINAMDTINLFCIMCDLFDEMPDQPEIFTGATK